MHAGTVPNRYVSLRAIASRTNFGSRIVVRRLATWQTLVAMASERTTTHPILRRSPAEERLTDRLRKICMALPEANERLSHGEPTWFAGKGKVFAMLDSHHHGSAHLAVWLPHPPGAQEQLINVESRALFSAAFVGPSGWVGVILDTKPDWSMVESMVRDAYSHVATAKLRRAMHSHKGAP